MAGGYGMGQEYRSVDHAAFADDRVATQDGCPGIEHDFVFDGRMSLAAAPRIPVLWGQSAQCYPLVNLYVITNLCCLANHHPGAMVDKKRFTDLSAGMDVNASFVMGIFPHDPR